jgi:hypothetical protein
MGSVKGKKEGRIFKKPVLASCDTPVYFQRNQWRLGEIVRIELLSPERADDKDGYAYPCRLKDKEGNEMWLSGATSGYWGGGPRATLEILSKFKLKKLLAVKDITKEMMEIIVHHCSNFVIEVT